MLSYQRMGALQCGQWLRRKDDRLLARIAMDDDVEKTADDRADGKGVKAEEQRHLGEDCMWSGPVILSRRSLQRGEARQPQDGRRTPNLVTRSGGGVLRRDARTTPLPGGPSTVLRLLALRLRSLGGSG